MSTPPYPTYPEWKPDTASAGSAGTFYYFTYGSNLWRDQMHRRCPDHAFVGKGYLPFYRWIINMRGYANVIPSLPYPPFYTEGNTTGGESGSHATLRFEDKDSIHRTWGVIYTITQRDMNRLDQAEGTNKNPPSYVKVTCPIVTLSENNESKVVNCLVYIDMRTAYGKPEAEYITRLEKGLKDAALPGEWVSKAIAPWLKKEVIHYPEKVVDTISPSSVTIFQY